jgi:hypothetical protein
MVYFLLGQGANAELETKVCTLRIAWPQLT